MTPQPEEHDENVDENEADDEHVDENEAGDEHADENEADDEHVDENEADDENDEEETPQVLVATLADLGGHLPEGLRKGFGSRPCWFIRQEDEELVSIFDHLPEDPMPKGRAHELLRALRAFAEESSEKLQELLGVAEGIVYGFHGDASLEQVTKAFEDDGFFVWSDVLRGGAITLPEA